MTVADRPDRGLQPERTALSWQRFGLAQFALGLALPRIAQGQSTVLVVALSGLAAASGLVVLYLSRRRYSRHSRYPDAADAVPFADGRLPLVAATAAALTGAGVISVLVT